MTLHMQAPQSDYEVVALPDAEKVGLVVCHI